MTSSSNIYSGISPSPFMLWHHLHSGGLQAPDYGPLPCTCSGLAPKDLVAMSLQASLNPFSVSRPLVRVCCSTG